MVFVRIAFLFVLILSHNEICLAEYPQNWPWIGVTVNSLHSNSADIYRIKKILPATSAIRVTLQPRMLARYKKIGYLTAWQETLDWADTMLTACQYNNIVAILSISEFPIDPSLGFMQSSSRFWYDDKQLEQTVSLVGKLAKHFAGKEKDLVAFEVLNEPEIRVLGKPIFPKKWPALQTMIIAEIRKYSQNWIVATLGMGGMPNEYKKSSLFSDNRIVYGAHMYIPHKFTHQGIAGRKRGYRYPGKIDSTLWDKEQLRNALAGLRNFHLSSNRPIWIGEFSTARWASGGEQYLKDLVQIFNEYQWGWAYFNIGGMHAWHPDYSTQYSSNDQDDWSKQYIGIGSERWKTLRTFLAPFNNYAQ